MEPDLYQVLQVHPTAEPEVIDAAFRRLTRKYHPDVNRAPDATQVMGRITAAYQVLRDPERRAAYDRELARRGERDAMARRPAQNVPAQGVERRDGTDTEQEGGIEVSLLGGLAGLGIKWKKGLR